MSLGELEVGKSLGGTPGVWPKDDPDNPVCRMNSDLDRETAKRYARLFAAAPDLLAACKEARAMMAASMWWRDLSGFTVTVAETAEMIRLNPGIKLIDAAVAKAEAQS